MNKKMSFIKKLNLILLFILGIVLLRYAYQPKLSEKLKNKDKLIVEKEKTPNTKPQSTNYSDYNWGSPDFKDAVQALDKKNPQIKNSLGVNSKEKLLEDSNLNAFNPKLDINYEVIDGYAVSSGDILLGQPVNDKKKTGQTAFNNEIKLWPNGEIHYAFDAALPISLQQRVKDSIQVFTTKTSLKFIEYNGLEKDFIVFAPSENLCASYVGRVGGAQPVFLNSKCQDQEIQHEIMHVLGFIHEHQREIRDQSLIVFEDNVIPEKKLNFDILPDSFQNIYRSISSEIDFNSIMIYPSNAFIKDSSLSSIIVKNSNSKILKNRQLSPLDIEKINNLYFRKF